MNSPNLQKLITTFLILAALTSSFVFLLSNTKLNIPTGPVDGQPQQVTVGGQNAFVESPSAVPSYDSPLLARSNIDSNIYGAITNNFTDQLAQKLMAANPNGPDLSKANPLTLPKNLGDLGGVANLVAPSFMPDLQTNKIRVADKYSYEDVMNYLSASQSAIQDILAPGLGQVGSQSLSLQSLGDLSAVFDQAENKIYQASVPAPLSSFNRSLLGFIDVQHSFFDQTDPAKTLIALQNPGSVIRPYQQAVQLEAQKLKTNLPKILSDAGGNKNSVADAMNSLFGIQKAYAFVDIIGGPSNIINLIVNGLISIIQNFVSQLTSADFWRKLFTEYLKDQLVHKLVQQVILWVRGGGKPQYVTNWQGFLGDSFKTGVSGVITKYAPGLCGNFRPLIKVALSPVAVDYNALINPYRCTLDRVVGNLTDFQNSFNDGGWIGYTSLLQPQNNFYGSLLQLSDASTVAGTKAQTASQNSANSASGFLSTKDCVHRITVNPENYGGGVSSESDARAMFTNNFISCSDAKCSFVTICDPDDQQAWRETTPGKTVADTLNQNLGTGPLQRIVNAQDFTALITALVNSALTKLVGLGQEGLTGLTADKLAQSGSLTDTCNGLNPQNLNPPPAAYTNCINQNKSINGTVNSSSGSQKDAVLTKIKSVLKTDGQLLDESNKILTLVDTTLGALNTVSSTCADTLNQSSSTIDAQNTLSFISQSEDQLLNTSSTYNGIITDLTVPGSPDKTLANLSNILSLLQNDDIASAASLLNITLSTTGDSSAIKEQFYSDLGAAVDNPGSTFGNLFGTVQSSGDKLATAKQDELAISQPDSCGILEEANGLFMLKDTCSLRVSKAYCRANGGPT